MKIKKTIKASLFILIIIMILILGSSYAWLKLTQHASKTNVVTAGILSMELNDEISNGIYLENSYPMLDEEGMQTESYIFTVKNNGDITSYYTIYFDDVNSELFNQYSRMNPDFVKYYLLKNNSDDSTGIMSTLGDSPNRILDQGVIAPGEINTYELKLWISSTATKEIENTAFAAQIRLEAAQNNMYPQKVTVAMPSNTKNERNFTWHTKASNLESDVQIVKATNQKAASIFENSSNVLEYSGEQTANTLNLYVHQAKATNLESGTKYYYRVGDKSKNSWSSIGEFITDNGDDNFSFIYVADQQTSSAEAMKSIYTMKQAMSKVKNSEFILNAGDLLNNATNEKEWINNLPFSVYGNTTTINSAGNHDYSYNGELPYALKNHFYYDLPDSIDSQKGIYYSLNYGNAHITVLNTNSNWYGRLDETQLEWLKNDLASSTATFKIVLMHRGAYTTGPHYYHYQDIQTLTNQLTSVMSDYGVDLVMQGHDHVYALTYPINSSGNKEEINTTTVYSDEINSNIQAMQNNASPIYFIGGTAGTKYEPQLIKNGDEYIVDPTSDRAYSYSVKPDTATIGSYFSKFQKTDTPKNSNGTNLAMFSSIDIKGNQLIVNSYTVDNQNYGEVKLYHSFGITK